MYIDRKSLLQLFSDRDAPKFAGDAKDWGDWEFNFRRKFATVVASGPAALDWVENKGNPHSALVSEEDITGAGYQDTSEVQFSALAACYPIGSPPLNFVRAYEERRNGLQAWQVVKHSYKPRPMWRLKTKMATPHCIWRQNQEY